MHRRRRRRRLFDRLMQALDVPCDVMPGNMSLEIIGDSDVIVGGCTAISEYSDEKVILCGTKMRISVIGEQFELSAFADDVVKVSGKVSNIEINREA